MNGEDVCMILTCDSDVQTTLAWTHTLSTNQLGLIKYISSNHVYSSSYVLIHLHILQIDNLDCRGKVDYLSDCGVRRTEQHHG